MKKNIKIKFVDFWPNFNYKNHMIYQILEKHFNIEVNNNHPDYIFFSIFGEENLKYKNCVRIFYTAENITPDFNICDYAIGFDYLDFGDRYLRLPNFYNVNYNRQFNLIKNKPNAKNILCQKTDFCSFVYSNSKADKYRQTLFKKVNEYKKVKSGGRFHNNIGYEIKDKIEFQKKFKFCIACENSSYSGYTTEKILDAFASYSIPIYWGDEDVTKVFNKKAFINCKEYDSFEKIIDKIKELDNNDKKYMDMISQPIFVSDIYFQNNQLRILEKFLLNIFNQEYSKTFRYNRTFYRELYFQDKLLKFNKYKHTFKYILKKTYTKLKLLKIKK